MTTKGSTVDEIVVGSVLETQFGGRKDAIDVGIP